MIGPNMAGWGSGGVWRRTSENRRQLVGELERTHGWRFACADWTTELSVSPEATYQHEAAAQSGLEILSGVDYGLNCGRVGLFNAKTPWILPKSDYTVKITFVFDDT